MNDVLGCILTAAITFPLSFVLARGCLKGVLRIGAMRAGGGKPTAAAPRS